MRFVHARELSILREVSASMMLGPLLHEVRRRLSQFEVVDHWQQGEFHHDTVLLTEPCRALPGQYLVVATNCNGGVKEILCFGTLPTRSALWKARCPESTDFSGDLPPLLGRVTTPHFFDPCELLTTDARSELKAEFRVRQHGGGWMAKLKSVPKSG